MTGTPLSTELRAALPADTAKAWLMLRDSLPTEMVLFGGTGITAHLHHRVSQDLDFFFHGDIDLKALRAQLEGMRPTAVSTQDDNTLNVLFGSTKAQFLRVTGQQDLEPPAKIEGMRVASLRDLMATKLKVIIERGQIRDYYDIMVLEQRTSLRVDTSLLDYQQRYGDENPHNVYAIIRGLGYLNDVTNDPELEIDTARVKSYWEARAPELVLGLDSTGNVRVPPPPSPTTPMAVSQAGSTPNTSTSANPPSWGNEKIWVEGHIRNGRHINGYWRRR